MKLNYLYANISLARVLKGGLIMIRRLIQRQLKNKQSNNKRINFNRNKALDYEQIEKPKYICEKDLQKLNNLNVTD